MLNIFVCNNRDFVWTSLLHFARMMEYLIEERGYKKIFYDTLVGMKRAEITKYFIDNFGAVPDNLIFYECLDKILIISRPHKTKFNIIIDDIHHQGRTKKNEIIGLTKTTRIFSTYGYTFAKYFDTTVPVYFFPHSSAFINDINPNPINKLLISGRQGSLIYPFRHYMVKESLKNDNIDVLGVDFSYTLPEHDSSLVYGKNYIDKLSEYLCCFTCDASDARPYIVSKHFEIPASGSLLLAGNINTIYYFTKLGFIDGEHYIAANESNIMSKVSYILDPANAETINKIRKSGHDKFCSTHTFIHRAKWLDDILNDVPDCSILQSDGANDSNYYIENYGRK